MLPCFVYTKGEDIMDNTNKVYARSTHAVGIVYILETV
jgi:hypothetical protein